VPEKKKSWPEEFVAEVWPNFARSGRKGPNKFLKEFPSFTGNDKHSETMTKFILQFY
jgi:hypothetical protein